MASSPHVLGGYNAEHGPLVPLHSARPPHPLTLIFCGVSESGISRTIHKWASSIPDRDLASRHIPVQYQHQNLTIIDLPGFLCGDDEQEALNHANIQLLLHSTSQINQGHVVVLYFYPAAEIRMIGPASVFRQSLRILKSHNIVQACTGMAKRGRPLNLIVFVTNTTPSSSTQVIEFMTESIRNGFQTEFDFLAGEESAEILITFLENNTATVDQVPEQIIRASTGLVSSDSLQAVRNALFLQVASNNRSEDEFSQQYQTSVEFLSRSKLVGSLTPTSQLQEAEPAEGEPTSFLTCLIGQGVELTNPPRYIALAHDGRGLGPATDIQLGSTTVQIPKAFSLTRPEFTVRLASAEHKKGISWFTFHVPLLQLTINSPKEFLARCEPQLAQHFIVDPLATDAESAVQTSECFRRWGTHLVVGEEQGGAIQALVTWQYLVRQPSNEVRAAAGEQLRNYFQALLGSTSMSQIPKLELPSSANLRVIQLQELDEFKSLKEGELSRGCMAEWIQARQSKPMPLQQSAPPSNTSGSEHRLPDGLTPWLVPYFDCLPMTWEERNKLVTKTEYHYTKLGRSRYDPRGWVDWCN